MTSRPDGGRRLRKAPPAATPKARPIAGRQLSRPEGTRGRAAPITRSSSRPVWPLCDQAAFAHCRVDTVDLRPPPLGDLRPGELQMMGPCFSALRGIGATAVEQATGFLHLAHRALTLQDVPHHPVASGREWALQVDLDGEGSTAIEMVADQMETLNHRLVFRPDLVDGSPERPVDWDRRQVHGSKQLLIGKGPGRQDRFALGQLQARQLLTCRGLGEWGEPVVDAFGALFAARGGLQEFETLRRNEIRQPLRERSFNLAPATWDWLSRLLTPSTARMVELSQLVEDQSSLLEGARFHPAKVQLLQTMQDLVAGMRLLGLGSGELDSAAKVSGMSSAMKGTTSALIDQLDASVENMLSTAEQA
jgi:hypothetical protein